MRKIKKSRVVHQPVMVEEVLSFLAPKEGVYVDMTVGAGGHAQAVLTQLANGYLIGIDRDEEILAFARENLAPKDNYSLHCGVFSQLAAVLREVSVAKVNGILFDLGVSSYQLEQSRRGFSFCREGPLDMRMGHSSTTAMEILRNYSEKELATLFIEYGEEPKARSIARAIVKMRKNIPITSTLQLANLIATVSGYSRGRIHPATRTFQALRIAVNQELLELERGLQCALDHLVPGGIIVALSFHSIEDRLVKQFFRSQSATLEILTTKPLIPNTKEQKRNPRSRSAKLRCARRKQ